MKASSKKRAISKHLARMPAGPWELVDVSAHRGDRVSLSAGETWLDHCWRNNHHAVQLSRMSTQWGIVDHLWISRHDGRAIRSWPELQVIKDHVGGAERVAVEVFPAKSELVDHANMYHLWVLPSGFRLPFGLQGAA